MLFIIFTMDDNSNAVLYSQQEKIKLKKLSKGYGWEITLIGTVEEQLIRLKKINDNLKGEYNDTTKD